MCIRDRVHDFRAADLALGGQGAPLVPRADTALLGRTQGWRALLNLGGIANLTLIPPCSGVDRHAAILGWDCGPANSLIDLGMRQFTNGTQSFDKGGAMAAQGHADEGWIQRWLQEEYFQLAPPKSTGRECFGQDDLNRRLLQLGGVSAADAIATPDGLFRRCGCPGSGAPAPERWDRTDRTDNSLSLIHI